MKNTTKKILSMLLAVIMLLSVMPVAFAAEKSQYYVFVEERIKLDTYYDNVYDSRFLDNYIWDTYSELIVNYRSKEWVESNPDKVPEITEKLKEANADIEGRIANGEATIVINFYNFNVAMYTLDYYVDGFNEFEEYFIVNSEKYYPDYIEELRDAMVEMGRINDEGGTQAEFDAAAEKMIDFYKLVRKHLEGVHDPEKYIDNGNGTHKIECNFCGKNETTIHTFSEYISNGDATEEADGTKTAICEFCGVTDTVIDEGSKIDNNDNSKCSCNCHKSGIMAFIWKILNFFYKIFGMNKTCACGVAHY